LTTAALTVNGSVEAIETRTLPIGTFTTLKYSQTRVAQASTHPRKTIETCWVDVATGRAVECSMTYAVSASPGSPATSYGSQQLRLEAYAVAGQPAGSVVRRFAGYWDVRFSGSQGGECLLTQVAIDGTVSGSCTATGGGSFSVSGTIDAAGVVNVAATTGAILTGSLATPSEGAGTWVNGLLSGTWTAKHL
jgi:hypothetical protein